MESNRVCPKCEKEGIPDYQILLKSEGSLEYSCHRCDVKWKWNPIGGDIVPDSGKMTKEEIKELEQELEQELQPEKEIESRETSYETPPPLERIADSLWWFEIFIKISLTIAIFSFVFGFLGILLS